MTLFQQAVSDRHLDGVMSPYFGLFALTALGGMTLASVYGDQFSTVLLLNVQGLVQFSAGVLAILFLWHAHLEKVRVEMDHKAEATSVAAQ